MAEATTALTAKLRESLAIKRTVHAVEGELARAMSLHPSYNSSHEAYAVILEELDEFWEEVRKKTEERSGDSMRTELLQIAATALRSVIDLDLVDLSDVDLPLEDGPADAKVKRARIFCQNQDSGDPRYFCGTVGFDAEVGLRNIAAGEACEILNGADKDPVRLEITVEDMTDAEVAEIPDY